MTLYEVDYKNAYGGMFTVYTTHSTFKDTKEGTADSKLQAWAIKTFGPDAVARIRKEG